MVSSVVVQVEDVDKKFAELDKLQASDWVLARQSPVRPKRVVVSTVNCRSLCSYPSNFIGD